MSPNSPLGITMGDPAGIGPEIVAKAFGRGGAGRSVMLGDPGVMQDAFRDHAPELRLVVIKHPSALDELDENTVGIIATSELSALPPLGRVNAQAGQAAFSAIREGIAFARGGDLAGLVTAPIHKEALAAAGVPFPGHTEMLDAYGFDDGAGDSVGQGRDRPERVAMMLANDDIRTVLVTIHCSLREAIDRITPEAEIKAIRLADEGARAFGVRTPRVAVAGLNPHAGEGGLFGREEIDVIAPAITRAQAEGIDASGPWPGDTVFMQARAGRFDVVVAQYHDQGLIPVKYLGVEDGVNVTLGLPFVRTSPDHGTAFDIAGSGVADPRSLMKAVDVAWRLVLARGGDGGDQNNVPVAQ